MDQQAAHWRARAGLLPPCYQREPDPPAPAGTKRPAAVSSWTPSGFAHALSRLLEAPLDRQPLTSTSYELPARIARHIKLRDQTCVFPSCRRLARDCQNDHLLRWPDGPTSADNTASECTHHHQSKHAYFHVRRTPDGTLQWTTPSGLTVPRRPRPLLRGW